MGFHSQTQRVAFERSVVNLERSKILIDLRGGACNGRSLASVTLLQRRFLCYRLALDSLYGEIQPNLCCHNVHKDKIEITLSKVTSGPSDGPDTDIFTWFSLRL
ncbi:unnamed protein product [Closterium sp. NIES-64]|nr:unnamed protein product [Closterium sp. NIES-64]